MVASFLGFKSVAQAEIVEDVANGLQDNRPGDIDEVGQSLRNLVTRHNQRFPVNTVTVDSLDVRGLLPLVVGNRASVELMKEMPLIALTGTNRGVGHFVVLTHIQYSNPPAGKRYTGVAYFDPWPDTPDQKKARESFEPFSLFCQKARYIIRLQLA
jgi:hypothetical protein